MKSIFEQGTFNTYSRIDLSESRSSVLRYTQFGSRKTTVFISHKHDDLDDLKGVIGFLQRTYNVNVYIDSQDPSMPRITSAETAFNIRERIKQCDKFILLATNGAIESKWCNWELGYGDAKKYKDHIALLPLKPQNTADIAYKGSEYMSIYPYITHCDSPETNEYGRLIQPGYYVCTKENGVRHIKPLSEWLNNR